LKDRDAELISGHGFNGMVTHELGIPRFEALRWSLQSMTAATATDTKTLQQLTTGT